jgi:hypothetical protein
MRAIAFIVPAAFIVATAAVAMTARKRIVLPCVRFHRPAANRLGWSCVCELETIEARRKFRECWERMEGN